MGCCVSKRPTLPPTPPKEFFDNIINHIESNENEQENDARILFKNINEPDMRDEIESANNNEDCDSDQRRQAPKRNRFMQIANKEGRKLVKMKDECTRLRIAVLEEKRLQKLKTDCVSFLERKLIASETKENEKIEEKETERVFTFFFDNLNDEQAREFLNKFHENLEDDQQSRDFIPKLLEKINKQEENISIALDELSDFIEENSKNGRKSLYFGNISRSAFGLPANFPYSQNFPNYQILESVEKTFKEQILPFFGKPFADQAKILCSDIKIQFNANDPSSSLNDSEVEDFFDHYFLQTRSRYFVRIGKKNDCFDIPEEENPFFANKKQNNESFDEKDGYLAFGWMLKRCFLFRFPIPLHFSSIFCKILWSANENMLSKPTTSPNFDEIEEKKQKFWENLLPNNLEYLETKLLENPHLKNEIMKDYGRLFEQIMNIGQKISNFDEFRTTFLEIQGQSNDLEFFDLQKIEKLFETNKNHEISRVLLTELYKNRIICGNTRKRERLEWIIEGFGFGMSPKFYADTVCKNLTLDSFVELFNNESQ